MQLLTDYFELQRKIYEFFGYQEDWVVIPLDDHTEDYWYYDDVKKKVWYSSKPFTLELVRAGKELYSGTLYTQRFLPKWIYEAGTYTMISVDTHCDGNKFLMIFDNHRKLQDPSEEMIEAFREWIL